MARCTRYTLCNKVYQWFSPGTLVSSANKTDCHDITKSAIKHHDHNPQKSIWVYFGLNTYS